MKILRNSKITGLILLLCASLCASGCAGKETGILWEGTLSEAGQTDASGSVADGADVSKRQDNAGTGASKRQDGAGAAEDAAKSESAQAVIVVDICGAVARPGVYELAEGSRVCDAVELAGGLLEEADVASLNRAAPLSDGDKILVYTAAETAEGAAGSAIPSGGAGQKVNINRADIAQLCTLSGIGEARARDIIAYRETNGVFQSIEDIMKVSGIKNAVFERIKEDISVR